MRQLSSRVLFLLLGLSSVALLASGLILGDLLRLQPCYLCNFQRFLYLILAFFGLCGAVFARPQRLWSGLIGLTALGGVATAAQQSWMQYAPQLATECGFGEPTPIERIVDWLSFQWPSMFMVTGFCTAKDWVFLGLSLANWSGVCFALLFACAAWVFFRCQKGR